MGIGFMKLIDHLLEVGPYDQSTTPTNQEETLPSLDEEDIENSTPDEPN